jgi:hypothetical protein
MREYDVPNAQSLSIAPRPWCVTANSLPSGGELCYVRRSNDTPAITECLWAYPQIPRKGPCIFPQGRAPTPAVLKWAASGNA